MRQRQKPHPELKVFRSQRTHWMSPKLDMRVREEKGGYGVFATQPITTGELLVAWGGDIVTLDQLRQLKGPPRRHSIQIEEQLYLVPHSLPEPGDFINHSCDPNTGLSGQSCLVARRIIRVGEEICYDYAMSDGSAYDEFQCACGSWNCRGRVTGNDWLLPELQRRYAGHFSPYLMRRIEGFLAAAPSHAAHEITATLADEMPLAEVEAGSSRRAQRHP